MSRRIRYAFAFFTLGLLQLSAQIVGGCPVFPSNNVWNTRIDNLPLDSNSAAYITTIGITRYLHPDFSASGGGIPFMVVPGTQPKVPIVFGAGVADSEPGPYPIPANAPIEGGDSASGDRHVLIVEAGNCILYELYAAYPQPDGSWQASSGAVFDLKSHQLRPAGWTSADAAGLPLLAGLIRYDEVMSGVINHALRITAPKTRNQYIWPARHKASSLTGTQYPPMGQRFRLKASFDISSYPRNVQVILTALKQYGAILADNGTAWYLTGEADPRWDDTEMHTLQQVFGSNMEAVDESATMVSSSSGEALIGPSALQRIQLSPISVGSLGRTTGNTVTLSSGAPTGGVTVFLSSSNPAAASVPASILIGTNSTAGGFAIQAGTVSTTTNVTITAFALGISKTATLTITPAGVASVSAAPISVVGGTASTGTVTLTSPAPSSGSIIALSTSNSGAAKVPSSITIPAGASSANFAITTFAQAATTQATITASYSGSSATGTISVTPLTASSVVLSPATLAGGLTTNLYVYISGAAGTAGMPVSLSSSNPSVAAVPATVTISPGGKYKYLTIAAAPVAVQTPVTISATAGGVTRSAVLTVNPAGIAGLSLSPAAVTGGTAATGTIKLGGISAADTLVTISSSLPGVASVPASATVLAGGNTVSFPITTAPVTVPTSVRITIKCGASVLIATLVVNP